MADQRVAVVTGANRGIGLEISRQLAARDIHVILTSRNEEKGRTACDGLVQEGGAVDFARLDVADSESIVSFGQELATRYGRCDILINNAGIFPDTRDASPSEFPSVWDAKVETIEQAMGTNVYGPLRLIQEVVPLMEKNTYGRIVNMSSGMGQLVHMNGGCPAYRLSKTALNALTRIVAEELKDENILVNSMCPGWVKTDMGGPQATRELPQGADTAVWLATLEDGGPRGLFFRDRKVFEW